MPLPFFISQPHHSQAASTWGYLRVHLSGPACARPLAGSGTRPVGGREPVGASRSWGVGRAASGEALGEPVVAGTGHGVMWPTPQEG